MDFSSLDWVGQVLTALYRLKHCWLQYRPWCFPSRHPQSNTTNALASVAIASTPGKVAASRVAKIRAGHSPRLRWRSNPCDSTDRIPRLPGSLQPGQKPSMTSMVGLEGLASIALSVFRLDGSPYSYLQIVLPFPLEARHIRKISFPPRGRVADQDSWLDTAVHENSP